MREDFCFLLLKHGKPKVQLLLLLLFYCVFLSGCQQEIYFRVLFLSELET